MKRIVFILPSLDGGGAEKVALTILKKIDLKRFKVKLYIKNIKSLENKDLNTSIEINEIKRIQNRYFNYFYDFIVLFKIIKENKKSVFFSQMSLGEKLIMVKKIFFFKTKSKFIFRETNIKSEREALGDKGRKIVSYLFYRYFINVYDCCIAQSQDMAIEMKKYCLKEKIRIINNPVNIEEINKKSSEHYHMETETLKLVTFGRLNYQKGYDLLIESLSKMKNQNYKLYILGIGEEKENLENLSKKLKIADKIKFLGYQENPFKILKNTDFFISSSRFEGFPNAVLEANCLGIPVIANNYKGGINEIIIPNLNGKIIDIQDSKELELSLKEKYDAKKIKDTIRERYDAKKIVNKYEKLFEEILDF